MPVPAARPAPVAPPAAAQPILEGPAISLTTRETLPPLPPVDDPRLDIARRVLEEHAPAWSPLDREGVARVLVRAERERGLPLLMVVALIDQESRFDAAAVGPRGARGLMQIKPFVGRDIAQRHELPFDPGVTLFDPVANVRLGVRYLGELRERFGTPELALAAYNMGPTRLQRQLRAGRDFHGPYVRTLLSRWGVLRQTYGTTESAIGG